MTEQFESNDDLPASPASHYDQAIYQINNSTTETPAMKPELLKVDCEILGDHGAHWQILTESVSETVPKWLELSIDDAVMPRGLSNT
ncbi:MAG TPA: hypothetical protein VIH30_04250, partial [Aquirhabdus sp.]